MNRKTTPIGWENAGLKRLDVPAALGTPERNAFDTAIKDRKLMSIPFYDVWYTVDRLGGSLDSCNPNVPHWGDFTVVTLVLYTKDGDLALVAPGVTKRSVHDKKDDEARGIYIAAYRATVHADGILGTIGK